MTQAEIIKKMNEKGNIVFLNPKGSVETRNKTYPGLIPARYVLDLAIGANTYHAFHRVNLDGIRPKIIFQQVLNDEYTNKIIEKLKKIESEEDLEQLENEICEKLIVGLRANIRENILKKYNSIRTPVNLFIENLVGLCNAFTPEDRKKIVPLLFLPLNSQIFSSPIVFSDIDIKNFNLSRKFTMGDITGIKKYNNIQEFLKKRAKDLGIIHRIYFDLVWNDKYIRPGNNLKEIVQ
jgi:hypothetical protein